MPIFEFRRQYSFEALCEVQLDLLMILKLKVVLMLLLMLKEEVDLDQRLLVDGLRREREGSAEAKVGGLSLVPKRRSRGNVISIEVDLVKPPFLVW